MASSPDSSRSPIVHPTLPAVLGLIAALAIVIGEVIGSGVFIKPNQIAKATDGYVGLILALWVICGIVSLCGALTLAELSAMMPRAGGTYIFLREAYGRMWGFLWCWAEFWVIRSGAIAALSAAMGITLIELARLNGYSFTYESAVWSEKAVAIGSIILLAAVNIIGTRWGGGVQVVTTAIKVAFVAFLGMLPFLAAGHEPVDVHPLWPTEMRTSLWMGIGTALAGIMWAYDGWGQVTVVAEEIKRPERNVPIALAGGVFLLILLYTGANLAYHLTLPSAEIAASSVPAVDVTRKLLGERGGQLVMSMMLVSMFGALNSNILVGPRVLFAVARDHKALRWFEHVDPRFGTPAIAIAALSSWGVLLILLGDIGVRAPAAAQPVANVVAGETSPAAAAALDAAAPVPLPARPKPLYDILTDYAIFGGSMFYLAAVLAVFIFRRTRPDAPRPYRTWGYPVVPLIFIVAYVFFIASMFVAAPRECIYGLSLIVAGLVFYAVMLRLPTEQRT